MSGAQFDNFFTVFLDESSEHFEQMNQDLVKLEDNPNDEDLLYSILRHVHTLKGSAGLFEFNSLKVIAHRLEDLMVLLQEHPKDVNRDAMDILFEGMDIMQTNVQEISKSSGAKNELTQKEKAFLDRLNAIISMIATGTYDLKDAIGELVQEVEHLLPAIEEMTDVAPLRLIMNKVHTILQAQESREDAVTVAEEPKPEFIGDVDVGEQLQRLRISIMRAIEADLPTEEVESFFADIEVVLAAAELLDIPSLNDTIAEVKDSIEIFKSLMLDFDTMQGEYYQNILEELHPHIRKPAEEEAEAEEETEEVSAEAQSRVAEPGAVARKTVRIEETKIDNFLDSVGELIILGEVFNNLLKRFSEAFTGNMNLIREFKATNNSYSQHIFSLQESLMDVRRVELRNITGNLNRLVRDAAKSVSKSVDLIIEGEQSVMDKSLLDDVNTCLVHILRNAVDHGIETKARRLEAGKSENGRIIITAENEDGFFLLKVKDDGAGINTEKLRTKMIEKGTHTLEEAHAMSEKDVWKMIFSDGVSTAEEVSDISGRGVGMAVVLGNIKKMNGIIDINSTLGVGTEVVLRIPLTVMLSVIDGLVVQVGKENFIIPIRYVQESFNPQKGQIKTVSKKGECAMLRENIYPLVRLSNYFGIPSVEGTGLDTRVGILVKNEQDHICLLVDNIVDHQQVVIKTIDGIKNLRGIHGGALLGDGTIGLVLDVDAIILSR